MCGRFTLKEKKQIKIKYDVDIVPSYNVCPKDSVLILDKNLLPRFLNWSFSDVSRKLVYHFIIPNTDNGLVMFT